MHHSPNALAAPLVVRCGAFGDMVLLTALIRVLNDRWQRPVDVLTSGAWSEPLLRGQPGVGEIFALRSRKAPYLVSPDQWRAVAGLRARGHGPVWYCDANDAARPLLERAGIDAQWIVDVRDHPLRAGEHATEQWARLARVDPAAAPAPAAEGSAQADAVAGAALVVGDAQRADLLRWLERRGLGDAPLMLVQMGNKRTMRRGLKRLAVNHKYWPAERWAEVLRAMRERCPRHALLLLGTGPEWSLNAQIAALAGVERCYNVADDLPIPRLLALLERGAGLVTVDSGPAHAAAALGCPLVVLFGRASPTLYRPRGRANAQVELLSGEVGGEPSMLGITTEAVIAAWRRLQLRAPSGGGPAPVP